MAEPANALSNGAFFLAAALLWLLVRRLGTPALPAPLRVLPWLIGLIGVGSSAFHLFAVAWTEVLDVACIGVFIYFFIVCFLRYRAELPWPVALLGIPAFFVLGLALTKIFPDGAFNGSVSYFPALAGLLAMGLYLQRLGQPDARSYLGAAGVFLVSLVLRSEDLAWCSAFPLGTHWLWHGLNAVTLWMVAAALIRSRAPAAA